MTTLPVSYFAMKSYSFLIVHAKIRHDDEVTIDIFAVLDTY